MRPHASLMTRGGGLAAAAASSPSASPSSPRGGRQHSLSSSFVYMTASPPYANVFPDTRGRSGSISYGNQNATTVAFSDSLDSSPALCGPTKSLSSSMSLSFTLSGSSPLSSRAKKARATEGHAAMVRPNPSATLCSPRPLLSPVISAASPPSPTRARISATTTTAGTTSSTSNATHTAAAMHTTARVYSTASRPLHASAPGTTAKATTSAQHASAGQEKASNETREAKKEEEEEEALGPASADILAALETLHLVTVPANPRANDYVVERSVENIMDKQTIKFFYYELAKRFHPDLAAGAEASTGPSAAENTDAAAKTATADTQQGPGDEGEMAAIAAAYELLKKLTPRQREAFLSWLTDECGGYRLYAQLQEGQTSFLETAGSATTATGPSTRSSGRKASEKMREPGSSAASQGETKVTAASSSPGSTVSNTATHSGEKADPSSAMGTNTTHTSSSSSSSTPAAAAVARTAHTEAEAHDHTAASPRPRSRSNVRLTVDGTAGVVINQDTAQLMGASFYMTFIWTVLGGGYYCYRCLRTTATSQKTEESHHKSKKAAQGTSASEGGAAAAPSSWVYTLTGKFPRGHLVAASSDGATSASQSQRSTTHKQTSGSHSSGSGSAASPAPGAVSSGGGAGVQLISLVSYIFSRYTAIVVAAVANAFVVRGVVLKLISGGFLP